MLYPLPPSCVRIPNCTLPLTNAFVYTGLCHNHCAILYVYIGEIADAGGVLTYYIPTVIDGDE